MDWIHCILCGAAPHVKNSILRFTSCQHVICDKCMPKGHSQCRACHKNCQVVNIASDMPHNVKEIFKNPEVLAKELFEKLKTATQFQRGNEAIYKKNMKKRRTSEEEKLQQMASAVKKQNEKVNVHMKELMTKAKPLTYEIAQLQERVKQKEDRLRRAMANRDQQEFLNSINKGTPRIRNDPVEFPVAISKKRSVLPDAWGIPSDTSTATVSAYSSFSIDSFGSTSIDSQNAFTSPTDHLF